ncbi:MAG: 4-hydroxythreonine-4-phosphate dehydrogenase [Candidatus Ordinivivax streblomastigis]|uniref:4-hydroxythreonine-4-phosphate dehydrogenase n=1 Tax=Candidatus Ordinivivax streblomastigis TaxID=2540710 RepID=A0A5M8P140_9BACT|nr:MAG: 4-hydroxythreonine-4-phosphate dehydrogenase [Candidatus Ordinivivax streblomastigis]
MNEKMIKVGITQGDTNGIACELILKTLDEPHILESCIPVIYGSAKVLTHHRKTLELPFPNVNNMDTAENVDDNQINLINVYQEDSTIEFGKPTAESAKIGEIAFKKALDDLKNGAIDVLVAAPTSLDPLKTIEPEIQEKKEGLKIWVYDTLRVALATDQITQASLTELPVEILAEKIQVLRATLVRDFGVTFPRIAVLSSNAQMDKKVNQAIVAVSEKGTLCFGPYPTESFFASNEFKKFDAILAMSQDQGMIAFHTTNHQEEAAIFIANLPYIITAPEPNAFFDKAGKNEASPDSFRNALFMAIDLFNNRSFDTEIHQNPLRKQYFERGSDNEKLDLTRED